MAAGLGFKTFTTGEVLTAADTNGYLMQGILVFASAAARDAAITSPQEGQFAYLKDTNVTTYYTGSAWANVDTTGMTNPMTTTGDIIYSSPGSTPVRLGIGSTGNVLTVAAGVPSWSAPAGGGKVLQVVQGTTSTSTTIATTSLTNSGITATITPTSASSKVLVLVNGIIFTQRLIAEGPQMEAVLLRDSTTILDYQSLDKQFVTLGSSQTNQRITVPINMGILDTPATTSATTYKVQGSMAQTANSAQVVFQPESTPSTIILMEIGA